ncbi:hypothetical protein Efla_007462 [Eimeria flavescens]
MTLPPEQDCTGYSLLSPCSSPPVFTEAELLAIKKGLARTQGEAPPEEGGAPRASGGPGPPGAEAAATSSDAQDGEADEADVLFREEADEQPDNRFNIQPRKYQQQFAALYFGRLQQLRPHVVHAAQSRWPRLPVLNAGLGFVVQEECVVIGTLFKAMPWRPSVLNDYVNTLEVQTPVATQEAAEPRLFLEDMTARIALVPAAAAGEAEAAAAAAAAEKGDAVAFASDPGGGLRVCGTLDISRCVTGLVVAVRGAALGTGAFESIEICLGGAAIPGPPSGGPPQGPPLEEMECEGFDFSSKHVAFVSGLRLGASSLKPRRLQLLRDFLLGASPSASLRRLSSLVVKLVVCGDCLSLPSSGSEGGIDRPQQIEAAASLPAALQEADCFLAQLASSVSLCLIPGPNDPTTFALPQRPLHAALLPLTRQFAAAVGATNPHAFCVDGVRFIGSSGQPVADICRNSSLSALEALELTAEGRCLAPTAPDSLACYPSLNEDPFCVSGSSSYHVYFAGLQQQHQHGRLNLGEGAAAAAAGVAPVCVCVPDFALRGELVLGSGLLFIPFEAPPRDEFAALVPAGSSSVCAAAGCWLPSKQTALDPSELQQSRRLPGERPSVKCNFRRRGEEERPRGAAAFASQQIPKWKTASSASPSPLLPRGGSTGGD